MAKWALIDIPWDRFDRGKLDAPIVAIVKAASLVELNGGAYAEHLCRIFADDPVFQEAARGWGREEVQHGEALGHWAELADPGFGIAAAMERFRRGYRIDSPPDASRRGSRPGEMIARCIVETGTSSYYSALRDATEEPVLKEICRNIAADEIRHYKLFYRTLVRCLEHDRVGLWRRLAVALGRITETQDDELAYAYYAANEPDHPYDRRRCSREYARRALAIYRERHVAAGVRLVCNAVGLAPNGRLSRAASRLAWSALRRRVADLAKTAA